eukprot:51520_1
MVGNWAPIYLFALALLVISLYFSWIHTRFGIVRCRKTTINTAQTACNFWSYAYTHSFRYHDLRMLCLHFVGLIMDTEMLNMNEKIQLYQLLSAHSQFIKSLDCGSFINLKHYKIIKTLLLYRATQRTFNRESFLTSCVGVENVLILLHNEHGNVFGGYISIGIKRPSYYRFSLYAMVESGELVSDANAFVFRVRSCHGLSPQIFPLRQDALDRALRFGYRIVFGFGITDFHLRNNGVCITNSYRNLSSYRFDKLEFVGASEYDYINGFAHRLSCQITNIEVFHVS